MEKHPQEKTQFCAAELKWDFSDKALFFPH